MTDSYSSAELRALASQLKHAAKNSARPGFMQFCTEDGTGEGAGIVPALAVARWIEKWGAGLGTIQQDLTMAGTEFGQLADAVDQLSDHAGSFLDQ